MKGAWTLPITTHQINQKLQFTYYISQQFLDNGRKTMRADHVSFEELAMLMQDNREKVISCFS